MLVASGVVGCLMRLNYLGIGLRIPFDHLLHAHSHTAMMGWIYLGLTTLIYHYFCSGKGYKLLFFLTSCSVVGLFISFLLQGYGLYSILFCTAHLLCSYVFVYKTLSDTEEETDQSVLCLKVALYLLVLSTMGLWAIGPITTKLGSNSPAFPTTIQFYIHFQFHGFFYFSAIALFLKTFDIQIPQRRFRSFLSLSLAGTFLTFALPLSWYFPRPYWHALLTLGAILQCIGLWPYLSKKLLYSIFSEANSVERPLLLFVGFALILKVLLPLFFLYPEFMSLSHEVRSITLGFIHLLMLGLISGALLFIALKARIISSASSAFKWGLVFFISGFFLTEGLLLFQGLQILLPLRTTAQVYRELFLSSLLLPLGAFFWLFSKGHGQRITP